MQGHLRKVMENMVRRYRLECGERITAGALKKLN